MTPEFDHPLVAIAKGTVTAFCRDGGRDARDHRGGEAL
jgi:hypothetical protein